MIAECDLICEVRKFLERVLVEDHALENKSDTVTFLKLNRIFQKPTMSKALSGGYRHLQYIVLPK